MLFAGQFLPNPLANILPKATEGGIAEFIGTIIGYLLGFLGIGALLVFIYGGIILLTSSGESGKIEKAKGAIANAILGLALVFSSYLILNLIVGTLISSK